MMGEKKEKISTRERFKNLFKTSDKVMGETELDENAFDFKILGGTVHSELLRCEATYIAGNNSSHHFKNKKN